MRPDDAAHFIRHLATRPGYALNAEVVRIGYRDLVNVTLTIDTVDSDEQYAPEYKHQKRTGDDTYLSSEGKSEETIMAEVLMWIMAGELHEWREFMRYQSPSTGRWIAPFHPHRPEGQLNWNRAELSLSQL